MKREKQYSRFSVFDRGKHRWVFQFLMFLSLLSAAVFGESCGGKSVDLRTVLPKGTIVYLETNDIGKALSSITDREIFKSHSTTAPDFSLLSGIRVAIAITDIETSEKKVTDEQSILNFTPKFIAVAETNAWSWQVNSIVENNLSDFVKRNYGEGVKFEQKQGTNSTRYSWTASDGRKSYAAVSGSLILFANDEATINQSLLAKSGDSESLIEDKALESEYVKARNSLAFGYLSKEGIGKIADLFGISAAVEQSEDEDVRGIIARILPKVVRNTVEEIVWTAKVNVDRIEDKITIKTNKATTDVLSETLKSASEVDDKILDFVPDKVKIATIYNLKNPRIAFRSAVLMVAENVDPLEKTLIAAAANSLLEPYGISKAEEFLDVIGSRFLTFQLDESGYETCALVKVKDFEKIKKAFNKDVDLGAKSDASDDRRLWKSDDGSFSAELLDEHLIFGESKSVGYVSNVFRKRALNRISPKEDEPWWKFSHEFKEGGAATITYGVDTETLNGIVRVLGNPKNDVQSRALETITRTRFTSTGIERTYLSDFGIFGTIIMQFDSE